MSQLKPSQWSQPLEKAVGIRASAPLEMGGVLVQVGVKVSVGKMVPVMVGVGEVPNMGVGDGEPSNPKGVLVGVAVGGPMKPKGVSLGVGEKVGVVKTSQEAKGSGVLVPVGVPVIVGVNVSVGLAVGEKVGLKVGEKVGLGDGLIDWACEPPMAPKASRTPSP